MKISSITLQNKNVLIDCDAQFAIKSAANGFGNYSSPVAVPKKELNSFLLSLFNGNAEELNSFLRVTFLDLGREYSFNKAELEGLQLLIESSADEHKLDFLSFIHSRLMRSRMSEPKVIVKMLRAMKKLILSSKNSDNFNIDADLELVKSWCF